MSQNCWHNLNSLLKLQPMQNLVRCLNIYYIHFEITSAPCNLIGSQQCNLFVCTPQKNYEYCLIFYSEWKNIYFLDNPSSVADLEANLARTMNHLAQNAKDLEVIMKFWNY